MERKATRSFTDAFPQGTLADIGGKVFVLGEYAVLSGAPALVAAVGPRFRLRRAETPPSFHAASPAGRYLALSSPLLAEFLDPVDGQGGWGGSTAEFALSARALGVKDVREAHRIYRELTARDSAPPPSGADLIAQWLGGAQWITEGFRAFQDVSPVLAGFSWMVFSATHLPGRKVKTHEHLGQAGRKPLSMGTFAQLRLILEDARSVLFSEEAWGARETRAFGHTLTRYAEALAREGLECEAARDDRQALSIVPGVVGVKGCGALLSDAVIVLLEKESSETRALVRQAAEARGLRFHTQNLGGEPGIRAGESV